MAMAKTLLGAALYFGVARCFRDPLAVGWVGMVGIIFLLHFGGFHLLSLAWRRVGVCAEPIMRQPLAAQSLGDFWGRRWNLAFNELAERFVFRPSVRRLGVPAAGLLAFFVSGLIHEIAISLPAGGGWGGPTAYFLIQGTAGAFERSRAGRRWGLRHGWRGRAFTLGIAAAPAFFLFHPPFVRNVIVPMMEAYRRPMNRELAELLLRLGGLVHCSILVASALVPRVLDWRGRLAGLHPFLRRLFWVYGVFIVLTIVGFGAISLGCAAELAAGTPLARAFCAFVAVFWLARLGVQFFVFDASEFLTTWWLRAGYHLLTLIFTALPIPYALVALGWLR